MTPELEALATARHAAWLAWDGSEGSFERFVAANRAYVAARDKQRQITATTARPSKAA